MSDRDLEDLTAVPPELGQVEEEQKRQATQDATSSSLDWTDAGDVIEVAGDVLVGAVDGAKDIAEGAVDVIATVIGGILDS